MKPTVLGEQILESLRAFDGKAASGAGGDPVAGVDEAGRGPLAGPVVAAAVILPPGGVELPFLNDSKQVSPKRREALYKILTQHASFGIGVATVTEIDTYNIFQAARLAMKRAVEKLPLVPALLLVDGKHMKIALPLSQRSIVRGDQKSASIAAASIIAKVYRDQLMKDLDQQYPQYGFKIHKGYATSRHLAALREFGPSSEHRKTFAPVSALLCEAVV